MYKEVWCVRLGQGFLQAVLLMSVFERRLSFQMFNFVKSDHEIILKCKWASGSPVTGSRRSPIGCSGKQWVRKYFTFSHREGK